MGYFKNIINDINRVSDVLPELSTLQIKLDNEADHKYLNNNHETTKFDYQNYNLLSDSNNGMNNAGLYLEDVSTENINEDVVVNDNSIEFYENIRHDFKNNLPNLKNNNSYHENKEDILLIPDDEIAENNEFIDEFNDFDYEENKDNDVFKSTELIKPSDNVSVGSQYDDVVFINQENIKVFYSDKSDKEYVDTESNDNVKNNDEKFKNNRHDNEIHEREVDVSGIDHQFKSDKDGGPLQKLNNKIINNTQDYVVYNEGSDASVRSHSDSGRIGHVSEKRVLDKGKTNKNESFLYDNGTVDARHKDSLHENGKRFVDIKADGFELKNRNNVEPDNSLKDAMTIGAKFTEIYTGDKNSKPSINKISENKQNLNESKLSENVPGKKSNSTLLFVENDSNNNIQKEHRYEAAGEKLFLGGRVDKYRANDKPEKYVNKASNSNKNQKLIPDVVIDQIDIKIEAPPAPVVQNDSPSMMFDLSSRYYLRRL